MVFPRHVIRLVAQISSWRLPSQYRAEDESPSGYRAPLILVHLLTLLLTCSIVLSKNKPVLFVGYDGALYQTTIKLQHKWMSRQPWASHDPFKALGNVFFCVNTLYSPGYTLATPFGGEDVHRAVACAIIAVELFLCLLLMAWCLRLRPTIGLLGAWMLTLLAMPFTFPQLFYRIAALCPHLGELIAIQALLIGLFYRVGQHRRLISAGIVFVMGGLILWCLVLASACLLLFLPVLGLFWFSFVVGAETREERWAKTLGMMTLLAVTLPTGLPYFAGNFLYSVPGFFGDSLQNDRVRWIWVSILFHPNGLGVLGPVVFVGSCAGSVLAWFSAFPVLRRLAACTLSASMMILGAGVYATFVASSYSGPSPLYFEIFLWPFYCLMFGYLVLFIFSAFVVRLKGTVWSPPPLMTRFNWPLLLLPSLTIVASFFSQPRVIWPFPPAETAIVRTLRDKLSLANSSEYRGTVATFSGYSRRTGAAGWFDIHQTDAGCAAYTSNDHRAMGLWYFAIPTVFEYNQYMTPSYYLMMTRMLARANDPQVRSVIVLSKPNPRYLRSIGVRFLITDFALSEPGITLVQSDVINKQITLNLYEMDNPNLATFSPTRISLVANAEETIARMQHDDFDFRSEAIADSPLPTDLVKATVSQQHVRKGRFVIHAASSGTSLLLLPLQFSHCLELNVKNSSSDAARPKLVRLNLMQAGLLFTGSVRVEIRFANGPFRNPFGRIEDYRDFKHLLTANSQTAGQ